MASLAQGADRPNVLWIIVDDLAPTFRAYQPPGYPLTPNINRLIDGGTEFLHAYCNYPSCGPSRTSFLSGLPVTATGSSVNFSVPGGVTSRQALPYAQFAPQLFKEQGYRVSGVGKIFHDRDPTHLESAMFDTYLRPPDFGAEVYTNLQYRGQTTTVFNVTNDNQLRTGLVGDAAVDYLAGAPTNQPWMIVVGFYKPHLPYWSTRADWEAVDPAQLQLPPETPLAAQGWPAGFAMIGQPIDADSDRRTTIRGYMACVRMVDRQIGRMFAVMDGHPSRYWSNTVVVLQSDHGYLLGEHQTKWEKNTVLEEAARAPLVIRAPGLPPSRTETIVEYLDIYPTLVDLCGLRPPWHRLDGRSLRPLMANPSAPTGWVDRPAITLVHASAPRLYRVTTPQYNFAISWWTQQADANAPNSYLVNRVAERLNWNGYPLVQEQVLLKGSAYNAVRTALYQHLLPVYEFNNSTNGLTSTNVEAQDPDLDGLRSYDEIVLGTYPHIADSDRDGLSDGDEFYATGDGPRMMRFEWDNEVPGAAAFRLLWSAPRTLSAGSLLESSSDFSQWNSVGTQPREAVVAAPTNTVGAYRVQATN